MRTLEEVIRHHEEVAEEYQRVVDTGLVSSSVTIDMLYCDDTEVIEEHLANYQRCASENRQLAEWLRELKAYKNKDMRLIYANPLDQAIRCAMCTNPIKSDRGCDGGCKVDEQMYKKVMEAVNGLIMEVNADEDGD